jgi:hypothetical protein
VLIGRLAGGNDNRKEKTKLKLNGRSRMKVRNVKGRRERAWEGKVHREARKV